MRSIQQEVVVLAAVRGDDAGMAAYNMCVQKGGGGEYSLSRMAVVYLLPMTPWHTYQGLEGLDRCQGSPRPG